MILTRNEIKHSVLIGLAFAIVFIGGYRNVKAIDFRNLDIESADIGNSPFGEMLAAQALPYWSNNNFKTGFVLYDTPAISSVAISIHDKMSMSIKPLQGNYSVLLQDGDNEQLGISNAFISQIGDVPLDARSLMFSTDMATYVNHLRVSLNGETLPFTLYAVGDTINPQWGPVKTYACDASRFAGLQGADLRFSLSSRYPPNTIYFDAIDLDAITFSSVVVPEPSSLVILAFGLFALAAYSWQRRNWILRRRA
jgi:hypothetical protein